MTAGRRSLRSGPADHRRSPATHPHHRHRGTRLRTPAPTPGGPAVLPTQGSGGYPPPGSPQAPPGVTYATWGIRVGGYLIDFVIFLVVLVVLFALFRRRHGSTST